MAEWRYFQLEITEKQCKSYVSAVRKSIKNSISTNLET